MLIVDMKNCMYYFEAYIVYLCSCFQYFKGNKFSSDLVFETKSDKIDVDIISILIKN